ncbi:MAG: ABC transporter ATP-binding protein [Lachnospiraceae bacterium]|nr:ABC transporter ATP-binding protein [Lachnospiraceae bacterium]
MLDCNEITKAYGKKLAVDHVSMKLEPGHIYAMLGPNGSGKTTLMKMAVGLVKPNSGGFTYQGAPVGKESRREIAYMSTEPYFYSWMSVSDVGKYYRDFFADFSMERYLYLLNRMELSPDMKTKSLSSGMMAKLKIAVTMARKAKVYLLDEPLNGIDLLARDVIIQSVIEECTPDAALVISSHLVDELERVVDTAIFIKDGRLVLMGDIEEFRTQRGKSVVDLYREIYGHTVPDSIKAIS